MPKTHELRDAYRFPFFTPSITVRGTFHDPQAMVISLSRRQKKTTCGACGHTCDSWYDARERNVRDISCGEKRVYLRVSIRRVSCPVCQAVKREALEWLAENSRYTKRFVLAVGRRCRGSTIKDVAEDFF